MRLDDFLSGRSGGEFTSVKPSYAVGTVNISPTNYLPTYITDSMGRAIYDFDAWLCGYNFADAVLTGPETRTTSPVRVLRNERFEAIGLCGLYPTGEGAGYAGGIISSACDGVRVAEAIIKKYTE